MPTPKLLPCPFCGGQAQACRDEDYCGLFSCYVECTKCSCRIYDEAEGMVVADAALAELAAAWNRRAPVMQGCRYSDGACGCRTSPLVPPSETPCEHVDNPARCKLYKAKGGEP